ncbi:gamma-aminobutyric acid receptor subunit alpha-2-like [Hydractinia symbiolongicarpus]|uniref:gamma-aminobutyric acid receptor subunit alpha-2-like n=1 Tax=Hydractinia symbiolongicarpus TaxID=13093 RepID=UPI0025518C16|nr:gamma-aminobutyric acid receptor subunit alpha-2-like [Hydractinia symbiolongicarpus]
MELTLSLISKSRKHNSSFIQSLFYSLRKTETLFKKLLNIFDCFTLERRSLSTKRVALPNCLIFQQTFGYYYFHSDLPIVKAAINLVFQQMDGNGLIMEGRLVLASLFAQKNNIIDKTSLILKDILQGYDRRAIPSRNGEAVQVVIELLATNRLRLNHIEKHYSLVLFLRERWKDYRLSYGDKYSNFSNNNYIALGGNSANSIWLPDIIFSGVRKLTHFTLSKPNLMTRIYADGRVLHSR